MIGVEGQLAIKRRGYALRDRDDAERVTVGRRLRADFHADVAAGTGAVVHYELNAERLGERIGDHAPDDVGGPAGWERHDDPHGFCGIGLRLCEPTREQSYRNDNQRSRVPHGEFSDHENKDSRE